MRFPLILSLAILLLVGCNSTQNAGSIPTPQATANHTLPLPVKGSEQTVYLVFDEIRFPIADWATFLAWGLDPRAIQTVSDEGISGYHLGDMLYRTVGDGDAIYFLIEGVRYRLDTEADRARALITVDTVTELPTAIVKLLPLTDVPLPPTFTAPLAAPDDMPYPVPAMPDPNSQYIAWLQAFPRPENDNGRCIHYLQAPTGSEFDARMHLARMQQLGVTWALINYTSPGQLRYLAPLYKSAGITVIWRPFVRPYQEYLSWGEDVTYLRALGVPPYIQILNEPGLGQEWDGRDINQAQFLETLIAAVPQVYEAGGFVGLQLIDLEWTRATLQRLKEEDLEYTFDRLFFVPHPYGGNHPPEYTEDHHGVLGFREFAQIFEEEIGFIPPMIAGEGGWRLGDASDDRFPQVTEELHRDYHLAVFEWFRTKTLSNGEPLPDYLFAFCPWLLADRHDPAAWFDSSSGDRAMTIAAVSELPPFTRRFSWDR